MLDCGSQLWEEKESAKIWRAAWFIQTPLLADVLI